MVRFHNEPKELQKIREGLATKASCDWFPGIAELHSFVGGPSRLLAAGRRSWLLCLLLVPCVSHPVHVYTMKGDLRERSPALT